MKNTGVDTKCEKCNRTVDVVEYANGDISLRSHVDMRGRCTGIPTRNDPKLIELVEARRRAKEREKIVVKITSAISLTDRLPANVNAIEHWQSIIYSDPSSSKSADAQTVLINELNRYPWMLGYENAAIVVKSVVQHRDLIATHPEVMAKLFGPVLRFFASAEFWAFVLLERAELAEQKLGSAPQT
jgi:hypothetical protein